jgi:acetoin utilization protein AcuB
MLVRYHMTTAVRTFSPSTRAADALAEMHADRFRFAPVVDGGRLVGVVTERDLVRKLPGTVSDAERRAAAPDAIVLVAHAMTRQVLSIRPNAHVEDAARVMSDRKINGLPVVDGGILLGVITASDLLHTLIGNDAAQEGRRVTALLPPRGPGIDLAALCAGAGLRLNHLMRHRARGGAFLASLRVDGPDAAVERLLAALHAGGAMLVESVGVERAAG